MLTFYIIFCFVLKFDAKDLMSMTWRTGIYFSSNCYL